MYLFFRWILFAIAIMITAWMIPGISVNGIMAALLVSIILGIINALIRPLVFAISLPINVLTLGLFTFVINALMLMLAGYISPGFTVHGFWNALLGSLILAIFGAGINRIAPRETTKI